MTDAADELELAALSDGYATAVDERDVDGLLAVFAIDATLARPPGDGTPGFELAGHDALRGVIRQLTRDYLRTSHVLGERRYEVDGDTARGEVRCTAHHLRGGDGGPVVDRVLHLRYLDTYDRSGGSWRITRRELHVDWTQEVPADAAEP